MLTARWVTTSNSVRRPFEPKKPRATSSFGVHDDTPHHVTVRPTGYCAERSSATPRHSEPFSGSSFTSADKNSFRYAKYGRARALRVPQRRVELPVERRLHGVQVERRDLVRAELHEEA